VTATSANVDAGGTRCFLALLPTAACRDTLRRCRESFAGATAGATGCMHWLDAASLHLTLRFLGNASNAQVAYLEHMLPTLAGALPVLEGHRYGVWPNRARPRMLVLELAMPDTLCELTQACETLARKAGFDPEPRAFKAHVTLARLRPGCAFGNLPSAPRALAFESLALIASDLQASGARYRSLASVALSTARES
jgi:2'-5' RNA ligase